MTAWLRTGGPSPRARGALRDELAAGSDHPRVRGEHHAGRPRHRREDHPRVRGEHMTTRPAWDRCGTIPACAGSTAGPMAVESLGTIPACAGSTDWSAVDACDAGTIPACAGSTLRDLVVYRRVTGFSIMIISGSSKLCEST